jgi:hypothetical protein
MKTPLLFLLAALCSTATAVPPPGTTTLVLGTDVQRSATITLGVPIVSFAPLPPTPALTFQQGTRLTFTIDTTNLTNPTVTWHKDLQVIAQGGATFEIAAATPADTGAYWATAANAGSSVVNFTSDTARVVVNAGGQRLLNVSTRAAVDANHPSFLAGFVVEPGPAQMMVLVRAIGPTLAVFGVVDPLPNPQLKLLDLHGHEQTPLPVQPLEGISIYPGTDQAAARVGAFPLPAGGRDVAQLFLLGPGAYTAHVSSLSGTTGTALLEIYEVPLPIPP